MLRDHHGGPRRRSLLTISKEDFVSVCNPEQQGKVHNSWRSLTTRVSPGQAISSKAPSAGRSLHHALLVELLIKLRRSEVRMHVLLQHPRAHRDFVDFALTEMRGALRVEVYNHASTMLQRVRAAIGAVEHVSADTEMHMRKYLDEQAKGFFVEQLRSKPCPRSSSYSEVRLPVVERLAERECNFVQHSAHLPATLTELDTLFAELCADYTEVLQIAHTSYVESGAFAATLDQMGAYAEGVAALVGTEAVATLASSFDRMAAPSDDDGPEYHFVPLEDFSTSRRPSLASPSRRPSLVPQGLSPQASRQSSFSGKRRPSISPRKPSSPHRKPSKVAPDEASKEAFPTG